MAAFYTLLTEYGRTEMARALAGNKKVQWTEMAVGDGQGAAVTPRENQTELVKECYRAKLSQLTVDAANPHYILAEMIIPTTVGGWSIEEVGIFDAQGKLVVVANFPSTYKPKLDEGSARDLVIRIIVEVANTSSVTLKIDPSVVLASQQWCVSQVTSLALQKAEDLADVINKPKALSNLGGVNAEHVENVVSLAVGRMLKESGKLSGEYAGNLKLTQEQLEKQALHKAKNLSDVSKASEALANIGGVNAEYVEKEIAKAKVYMSKTSLQRALNLNDVTDRIRALDALNGVNRAQNLNDVENKAQALANLDGVSKSQNLNDLSNKTQALANLGGISANHFALVPIGVPLFYPSDNVPDNYLTMNGQKINRSLCPELYALYGSHLPDLRGEFLRGWDGGRGVDKERKLLSSQADAFKSHTHQAPTSNSGPSSPSGRYEVPSVSKGNGFEGYDYNLAAPTSEVGSNETRPRNVAFNIICRAR